MSIPLVDLKKQYQNIHPEIDQAVGQVLSQGDFILGKEVEDFEKSFAKYIGVKYCVGVASGSDAILLSLRALGVKAGDEVIAPANTFISTILPIIELGAKPILVDVQPDTYQVDPQKIEQAITSKTRVILPVHLYGIPAPMDKIVAIAKRYHLHIIEDACQAHGSSLRKKMCGSFGEMAAFSFYPGKNLGAAGDGGCIVTNDKNLFQLLTAMRNIGQTAKYKHDVFGYNSRLDTIQAVILSIKLKHLDEWNSKRRNIAKKYNQLLEDLPITLPPNLGKDYILNYHLYVIRTKNRDQLYRYLQGREIYPGIHYPIPIHLQKAVQNLLGYKKGDFPVTETLANEILSLPMYAELEDREIENISRSIHTFFSNGR